MKNRNKKTIAYILTIYTCSLVVAAACLFAGIPNLDMNPKHVNALLGIILTWASVVGVLTNLSVILFIKGLRAIATVMLVLCLIALAEGYFHYFLFSQPFAGGR